MLERGVTSVCWLKIGCLGHIGDLQRGGILVTRKRVKGLSRLGDLRQKISRVEIQSSDFGFAGASMMVFHLLSPSIQIPAASQRVMPPSGIEGDV